MNISQALAEVMREGGVKRIFGVPGGGSSLDLIEAAGAEGIEFILARNENAAVMMAAVTAELSGTIGVVLTTKGPGATNAANGVAYASLDRAPVMFITDGFSPEQQGYITHQVFGQKELLAPITKGYSRLDSPVGKRDILNLVELATTHPLGPVHIELTSAAAKGIVESPRETHTSPNAPESFDEESLQTAQKLIGRASKPVMILGLEARDALIATSVGQWADVLDCPVLVTYKAKGVIADSHPNLVGIFTGGGLESDTVSRADLIILVGLDPVELILQPWRYQAPVIDIAQVRHNVHYVTPEVGLYGNPSSAMSTLMGVSVDVEWTPEEIKRLRETMASRMAYPEVDGVSPQQIVETALELSGGKPRITVDAGAHMFSTVAFWKCSRPYDLLISNGLATMAFALPAAIASALHDPSRLTIGFTGDGGFMMCMGELATAAQYNARIILVVFNDGALSLIDIKQQQQKMDRRGVAWPRYNFAQAAEGLGWKGYSVETPEAYRAAMASALKDKGPVLIDVIVDPAGYPGQLRSLRG